MKIEPNSSTEKRMTKFAKDLLVGKTIKDVEYLSNFDIDEMLWMIDALAFHTENGDVCPANWKEGKVAMKASDEGMRQYMAEQADNL